MYNFNEVLTSDICFLVMGLLFQNGQINFIFYSGVFGCYFSLIKTGKGTKVVKLIKDISSNYRNISQDPVVYCLALCARSDDVTTKREAYTILNDICRIPNAPIPGKIEPRHEKKLFLYMHC